METFKPERELRTAWLLLWLIWSAIALLAGVAPLIVLLVVGSPHAGLLPSLIVTASLLAVIVPIGIWIPAYYASIQYWIQPESVRAKRGVFWKRMTTVPYSKITNIDITQGPLQRALGIATIHVQTAGSAGSQGGQAEMLIYGIKDSEGLKEMMLSRVVGLRAGGGAPEKVGVRPESSTLDLMLSELAAIRRVLEEHRK